MKSEYKSGKSVGKNQTVPINVNDPRLAPDKIGQTRARIGAEIDIIGLDGKSLIVGGTVQSSSSAGKVQQAIVEKSNFTPPIGNEPPKYYPGGSGAFVIVPTDPTDVSVVWSDEDLVISFNWDYSNEYNVTISQFIVELTSDGVTKRTPGNTFVPNKTQTAQTITVTKSMITSMFNVFRTNISAVCVLTADPLNNISNTICAPTVPAYVLNLSVPIITVTSINNGYSVAFTTPTQSVYDGIEIVEYESDATTEPTGVNYIRTYFNTINPAVVTVSNFNYRWVKARFSSDGGTYTAYSTAQRVKPTSPVSVDLTPPEEVTQLSAVWSGDNIIVSYKLPSTIDQRASRVQIELTAPNTLVGYFYRFPDGSGRDQTTTITKKDLFDQFGEHYSSFTGILRSIDTSDNRTSGVSFTVATRANPLNGVIPTFTTLALSNAYSVNFTLPTGAVFAEVYAKHTAWESDPTDDTYVVYSGLSPAVIVDTDYTPVYIKLHYYDDFGNTSSYSNQSNNSVTPANPGEITSFENPISFGPDAVIYAGDSATSGTRTLFKTGGIFAYDATNTSPSTQIVSNASAGTPTFITTQAQIADWNITDTKIENTLSGAPTSYTGLSATGTYSFWAGSTVSGGNETSNFTVTPTGEVTAREITIVGNGGTDPLISAGGLFTVNNDGSFTATSADIQGVIKANSGEFLGNVKIGTSGSLFSGTMSGNNLSGLGFILNKDGLLFQNVGGSAITQITSSNGKLITTSAEIGGWAVTSSEIAKTSLSGGGSIRLNSSNGYISVSNGSVGSYTAGINGAATLAAGSNVFWAGTGGASSENNGFRVTLDGTLYATSAKITGGTITSTDGSSNIVTVDGINNFISMQTSLSSTYLFPRNSNTYLTSGNPFPNSGTGDYASIANLNNSPYLAAGSGFKDYWGIDNTKGIGIFTGAWDYFAGGTSTPFITATTTGLQLSAGPTLGLLLDAGTSASNGKLDPAVPNGEPSMLFYTAKNDSAPYSPTTTFGAWASFTNNTIKLSASSTAFINISGVSGAKIITLQAFSEQPQSDSAQIAYSSPSKISLEQSGVRIYGVKAQGDADIIERAQTSGVHVGYRLGKNGEDLYPLGSVGRQRMIVQSEYTGELLRGMAVYYSSTDEMGSTSAPSSTTGAIGDLFVVY